MPRKRILTEYWECDKLKKNLTTNYILYNLFEIFVYFNAFDATFKNVSTQREFVFHEMSTITLHNRRSIMKPLWCTRAHTFRVALD